MTIRVNADGSLAGHDDHKGGYTVDADVLAALAGGGGSLTVTDPQGGSVVNPTTAVFGGTVSEISPGVVSSSPTVVSDTDPGAIGAGNLWVKIDPTETYPPTLFIRNQLDSGWLDYAGAGTGLALNSYETGTSGVLRASIYTTANSAQFNVYDANGGFVGVISLGGDGSWLIENLGTGHAQIASTSGGVSLSGDDEVSVTAGSHSIAINSSGLQLDAAIFNRAAHVADGSTVDQLRDALIASGLMAAS